MSTYIEVDVFGMLTKSCISHDWMRITSYSNIQMLNLGTTFMCVGRCCMYCVIHQQKIKLDCRTHVKT